MNRLMRAMKGSETSESESSIKSTVPITRDLLGCMNSKEVVLDGRVPPGWERDFKTGNSYYKKCISSTSENLEQHSQPTKPLELKFPQPMLQFPNLLDNVNLDFKVAPPPSPPEYPKNYIFTVDFYKNLLQSWETNEPTRKRSRSMSTSSSLTSVEVGTNLEKSIYDCDPVAVACPNCATPLLVPKSNPICHNCKTNVPLPTQVKKPRFDLNISP